MRIALEFRFLLSNDLNDRDDLNHPNYLKLPEDPAFGFNESNIQQGRLAMHWNECRKSR